MDKVFVSSRVITPQGMRPAAIVVKEERIVAVTQRENAPQSSNTLDFGDLVLMPGLVDTHIHINEPGRTEWEGFETATRAAAAGGITTVVDMPLNCLPETTTVDALETKRSAAAGKCHVDWAAWGGLTDDNHSHILSLASAGVRGFKCFLVDPGIEGLTMVTGEGLERAAPKLAEAGLPLLVHAELPGPIAAVADRLDGADWRRYETYLLSRPDAAEIEAIRLLLRLCRKYRFPLHIVHLATALALEELAGAQAEGLPVTVETCPHYLHFAAEEIPSSATLLKCAPPVRSAANREALWNGLQQGTIQLIATDHSPCPPFMKRQKDGDFGKAWGGIASLSIAASVIWTDIRQRDITLEKLPQWMAQAPAALAGLSARKGAIASGMDADLVVFDPDAKFEVSPSLLHYRHKVSAYLGESLNGVVERTFLRGEEIYNKGAFPSPHIGQEQLLLHSRPLSR